VGGAQLAVHHALQSIGVGGDQSVPIAYPGGKGHEGWFGTVCIGLMERAVDRVWRASPPKGRFKRAWMMTAFADVRGASGLLPPAPRRRG